jgi:hypothetical protein
LGRARLAPSSLIELGGHSLRIAAVVPDASIVWQEIFVSAKETARIETPQRYLLVQAKADVDCARPRATSKTIEAS